jgi:hypothetical protein
MSERTMTTDEYKGYVSGVIEATLAVAEITGGMKLGDFNEQTWKMVCKINARLAGMAADLSEPQ